MAQTLPADVQLGAANTGLALGYRILALDGTEHSAFTTSGVSEDGSVAGLYYVTGGISAPDAGGYIEWRTSGTVYLRVGIDPAASRLTTADLDTALATYDAPTQAELDAALLALQGGDGDTLETLSDQLDGAGGGGASAADIDALLTTNHGAGLWTGGTGGARLSGSGSSGTTTDIDRVVQGALHTPIRVTWDEDLTGATSITGVLRKQGGGVARAIAGTLTLASSDSDESVIQWVLAAEDVAEAGLYSVQLTAHFGDDRPARTEIATWHITPALSV